MSLSSLILRCSLFVIFLCVSQPNLASNSQHVNIQPIPGWVFQHEISDIDSIPVDQIRKGIFYRLIDNQVKVEASGAQTRYVRYDETIVNDTGLDENSQINIGFDPEYQEVVLHSLHLIRNGETFDRLLSSKISVLTSETELKSQIYNGRLKLNILINDLRVGDTVSYSYSRIGANPVYKNIFSFRRGLTWSVPVHEQHVRVLWGKIKPLFITTRNVDARIEEQELDGFVEYKVRIDNHPTVNEPSQTPDWYDPYGSIFFSETETWAQVANWAAPLYQLNSTAPAVANIASKIRKDHESTSEKIVAALQYTQENIRYVGLEMGQNSHLPTAPDQTLELAYGDCKDKALLFIAILKALNIESLPALVNTEDTKLTRELPARVTAFDHVIVTLMHENKRIWLDPTLNKQEGSLDHIYQPNYAYALILDENQNALTPMVFDDDSSGTKVIEHYVIPKFTPQEVKFKVTTVYSGIEAINEQQRILEAGVQKLTNDYEVYYQRTNASLSAVERINTSLDKQSGKLQINETYRIANFWTEEEHYEADFYAREIRSSVFKPEQTNRNAPLKFEYPNNIEFQIQLEFKSDNWAFEDESFLEDNEFFYFKSTQTFLSDVLTVVFDYHAKTDHIAPDKMEDYLAARQRMRGESYLSIIKYRLNEAVEQTESEEEVWGSAIDWSWGIGGVYLFCIFLIIVSWRMESSTRPTFSDTYFYPQTLLKFLLLSFGTLGLYVNYWCYRNWKEIKKAQELDIMPIARGIFSIIWFYPLFIKLKEDSISRFKTNKVLPLSIAIVFATANIVLAFYANFDDSLMGTFIFLISILFYIPLVAYINRVNAPNNPACTYNSKWRLRQILGIGLYMPLIALMFLFSSTLLPSDEVVTQEEISDRDLKFLYRKSVLPANEEIIYFYSDAVFSKRDDGNGFTQETVFSYWADDNDVFSLEKARFDDIKNIDVEYDTSLEGTSVITIIRKDDSDFILFVSNVNNGDRRFFERLQALWKDKSSSELKS